MKTIFVLFIGLFFFVNTLYTQNTWLWLYPYPQGNDFYSVKFFNNNTILSAGRIGTIIKTTSFGANWSFSGTQSTSTINSFFFVDLQTGYSCGAKGALLKTTDQGTSWFKLTFLNPWSMDNYGLVFINEQTGFVVGNYTTIKKTTNGGIYWNDIYSSTQASNNCIRLIDSNTIYVTGGQLFLKTTNKGNNWVTINVGIDIITMDFANANTGIIAGDNGYIYRTSNAGINWNYAPNNTSVVISMKFINQSTGFLVAYQRSTGNSVFYKTTNAGLTWGDSSFIYINRYTTVPIDFFDSLNGVTSTDYGSILKTTNGGINWTYIIQNPRVNFMRIQSFDTSSYYLSANDGRILKTSNGGNSWLFSSGSSGFSTMSFTNKNIGFAATTNNSIYKFRKTTNAGENWFDVSSTVFNQSNDLIMLDSLTGFVTASWSVYKTTNGGINWSSATTNFGNETKYLYLLNKDTIFVSVNGGKIFRSTNAGFNWVNVFNNLVDDMSKITFVNNNTGYACTCSPTTKIFKTTNCGVNWFDSYSGIIGGSPNVSIGFANPNTGIAIISNIDEEKGVSTFTTSNGGLNWVQQKNICGNKICDVKYLSQNKTLAVGYGASIIVSTTGGITIPLPPILLFPSNNAINIPLRPTLTWYKSDYTEGYRLQISELNNFSSTVLDTTFYNSSTYVNFIPNSCTLDNYKRYYWRVKSFNQVNYSSWSEVFNFLVNNGANWYTQYIPSYSGATDVYFSDSLNGFCVGDSGRIFRTFNRGDCWERIANIINLNLNSLSFINNFGIISCDSGKVLTTSNSGNNWVIINTGILSNLFSVKLTNFTCAFAVGSGGTVIKSTNNGINWVLCNSGTTSDIYKVHMLNNNTGWFSGANNLLLKTTNGGINFSNKTSPVQTANALCFTNELTGWVGGNNGYLYKTTNDGNSWTQYSTIGNYTINDIYFLNDNTGWTAANYGRLSVTTNGGQNWYRQAIPVINDIKSIFFIDQNIGWFVGKNYMSYHITSGYISTSLQKIENVVPQRFMLEQNYPNPFNPSTIIKFSIPENDILKIKNGIVKLKVYNILGKEIATLVNEKLQAGTYEVKFEGTNLPSGVYYYKLSIDNVQCSIKKMILLK